MTGCSGGHTLSIWLWIQKNRPGYILSSGGNADDAFPGGLAIYGPRNRGGQKTLDVAVRVWVTENVGHAWVSTINPITEERWFHFAMTWNQDGNLTVFINGSKTDSVGRRHPAYDPRRNRVPAVLLFTRIYGQGARPNVVFDEMQIWTQEKTAQEIQRLYRGKNSSLRINCNG